MSEDPTVRDQPSSWPLVPNTHALWAAVLQDNTPHDRPRWPGLRHARSIVARFAASLLTAGMLLQGDQSDAPPRRLARAHECRMCSASERLTSGKTALVAVEPANSAHPSPRAAWAVVLRRPALDLHVLCAGPFVRASGPERLAGELRQEREQHRDACLAHTHFVASSLSRPSISPPPPPSLLLRPPRRHGITTLFGAVAATFVHSFIDLASPATASRSFGPLRFFIPPIAL